MILALNVHFLAQRISLWPVDRKRLVDWPKLEHYGLKNLQDVYPFVPKKTIRSFWVFIARKKIVSSQYVGLPVQKGIFFVDQMSENVKNSNSVQRNGQISLEYVSQCVLSCQCMPMDIWHARKQTFWVRNVNFFAIPASKDRLRPNHRLLLVKRNNQRQSGQIQNP